MKLNKTPLVLALMLGALVTVTFLTSAVQAQAGRGGAARPGGGEAAAQARTGGQTIDVWMAGPGEKLALADFERDLPAIVKDPQKLNEIVKLPPDWTYTSFSVIGGEGEGEEEACAEECNMNPEAAAEAAAAGKCYKVCFKPAKKPWKICFTYCIN